MMKRRMLALLGVLLLVSASIQPVQAKRLPYPLTADVPGMERITTGSQSHGGGSYAAISATGRYVAFESAANDMALGQISGSWDDYVHDRQTGTTSRVSVGSGGQTVDNPGDYTSAPAISADGRYVAFISRAENLVSNDGNGMPDVFVHDRVTNTTELISLALDGKSGNDASFTPAISADGHYVAFQSFASNLVKGDTNQSMDVFLRDRQLGTTELVSVSSTGVQGSDSHDYGFPGLSISGNGRFVAFAYDSLPVGGSASNTEPGVFLRDQQARTTRYIAAGSLPALSNDGNFLAFVTAAALDLNDRNGSPDVYCFNRQTNRFERVSLPAGVPDTTGTEITDSPSLSADGNLIAFATSARLVSGDTNHFSDIYLRDRQAAETTLLTPGADQESHNPAISADGSAVAFTSLASNLVADDTNGLNDVFVYSRSASGLNTRDNLLFLPIISNP